MPSNKKIWVIGGSTGFGASISNHYISEGWDVIISSSNEKKLSNFIKKSKTNSKNQKICFKVVNLSSETSITSTVCEILSDGPIDLLIITSAISNAKSSQYPMLKENLKVFEEFIKINSISNWLVIRSLFPKICSIQNSLKIILFSSKAGWSNTNHFGFYNISKSLLHHLALNLHEEIITKYNINCSFTILEPGEALSEMNKGSLVDPKTIIPIIEHIEKNHLDKKVYFINKRGSPLKFIETI